MLAFQSSQNRIDERFCSDDASSLDDLPAAVELNVGGGAESNSDGQDEQDSAPLLVIRSARGTSVSDRAVALTRTWLCGSPPGPGFPFSTRTHGTFPRVGL